MLQTGDPLSRLQPTGLVLLDYLLKDINPHLPALRNKYLRGGMNVFFCSSELL